MTQSCCMVLLSLILSISAYAQYDDTATMIKEFRKVEQFATQPYLYYSVSTSIQSIPVLSSADTSRTEGEFYKAQTDWYYRNGQEDLYLQDSLLIRIDHAKKSVWISRVDQVSKNKANGLLPGNKLLQEMVRKRYTIRREIGKDGLASLQFINKQVTELSAVSSRIVLTYATSSHFPGALEIEMRLQQPVNDAIVAQIKNQGIDETKLLQLIDGKLCLVRSQKISIRFNKIDISKEKAMQIPKWQSVLFPDPVNQIYLGKSGLENYTITKTF